ncbi:hypothetical protein AA14337_2998 [Acetobacter malorum DSM 14337]|uniref:Uncharacterized protein n=1 Tax=Acetobacter malorum DSM 14337 TaxID=1307910 RepID=A0ABQ0PZ01_9PROT|nr:hypothetical protein [Acetobacter malorum]KXV06707.1 hypothetical protein AD930_06275 [Acetobacter malorum]GBQ85119.1 hypothetical protein AA14337_2998 [Acetobacter malorum DSM 14337]
MPISAIAEVGLVERREVYSWLQSDAYAPKQAALERLLLVKQIFSDEADGALRLYCRVWNRRMSGKPTLKEALTSADIDADLAREAVSALRHAVTKELGREKLRKDKAVCVSPASHLTIDLEACAARDE